MTDDYRLETSFAANVTAAKVETIAANKNFGNLGSYSPLLGQQQPHKTIIAAKSADNPPNWHKNTIAIAAFAANFANCLYSLPCYYGLSRTELAKVADVGWGWGFRHKTRLCRRRHGRLRRHKMHD